jgi:uncharacterized small protein (DUF1192 family)
MIDQELTVEIVCEMYEEKILVLKKEIDRLNEEVQALNLELKKEKQKHNEENYDELDY